MQNTPHSMDDRARVLGVKKLGSFTNKNVFLAEKEGFLARKFEPGHVRIKIKTICFKQIKFYRDQTSLRS